jgi:hypothetical protein
VRPRPEDHDELDVTEDDPARCGWLKVTVGAFMGDRERLVGFVVVGAAYHERVGTREVVVDTDDLDLRRGLRDARLKVRVLFAGQDDACIAIPRAKRAANGLREQHEVVRRTDVMLEELPPGGCARLAALFLVVALVAMVLLALAGCSLPRPPVTGGPLVNEIQRVVRANVGRVRPCYERGLRSNPTLHGRVVVHFLIGRDGVADDVANAGSDLPDSEAVWCVVRSFEGLKFPTLAGGYVNVNYPLLLAPGAL